MKNWFNLINIRKLLFILGIVVSTFNTSWLQNGNDIWEGYNK